MKTFDYVVVGSGIAGLTFALKAADKGSVAIVTKSRVPIPTQPGPREGSPASPAAKTPSRCMSATHSSPGDGLCNEEVVRSIVSEGPERIAELIALGMHFDERTTPEGSREPDLGVREGTPSAGSSTPRIRPDSRSRRRCSPPSPRIRVSRPGKPHGRGSHHHR